MLFLFILISVIFLNSILLIGKCAIAIHKLLLLIMFGNFDLGHAQNSKFGQNEKNTSLRKQPPSREVAT